MKTLAKPIGLRLAAIVCGVVVAGSAPAQELDWRVTPYLWGTSIDGELGLGAIRRDVDLEFADILNVLSGAALLHVEAQVGDHVAFGDLAWFAVEPEEELATIGGVAEAELDATILELGYARAAEGLGIEVGLRYWDIDVEIDPALAAGSRRGDSWVDAFGGIRSRRELGENWDVTTRVNLGAGGSDLNIGVQMDFARELEGGNAIVVGFRLLDLDYEENNVRGIPVVVDLTFVGATFGFRFD